MSVATVTGAAGAIGGAVARRLAADGWDLLLVDLSDAVQALADELAATGVAAAACVTDLAAGGPDDVVAALERFDAAPGLLVNNAGITRDGRVQKLSDEHVRAVLRVNLVAPLRLAEALAPRLEQGGSIVNIASRAALGNFGQANYVAAKSGLIGATRALALEHAPRLRVNAVAPGLVDTPMTAAMPPEVLARLTSRVPLGRAGAPAEIADAVAFLASPAATYVTGQTLFVCGGRSIAA